jgi:23S rRNA (cytosine1962-C5)-methyltransferase
MVQLPTVSEADTRDEFTATPIGDYELLDFGAGRKLERWGAFTVDRPDRMARGKPAALPWTADWTWVGDPGQPGHWEPARDGVPREWTVRIGDQDVPCRLDSHGHVGLQGREIPCAGSSAST